MQGALSLHLKKRMLKAFVWSVALYKSETWTIQKEEIPRLEAFEISIWRHMACMIDKATTRNLAVTNRSRVSCAYKVTTISIGRRNDLKGHSRSLEMSRFYRAHCILYRQRYDVCCGTFAVNIVYVSESLA